MRLDIRIVAKTKSQFVAALNLMIDEVGKNSNSYILDSEYELDYEFTDCDDVHVNNDTCKVVQLRE